LQEGGVDTATRIYTEEEGGESNRASGEGDGFGKAMDFYITLRPNAKVLQIGPGLTVKSIKGWRTEIVREA